MISLLTFAFKNGFVDRWKLRIPKQLTSGIKSALVDQKGRKIREKHQPWWGISLSLNRSYTQINTHTSHTNAEYPVAICLLHYLKPKLKFRNLIRSKH